LTIEALAYKRTYQYKGIKMLNYYDDFSEYEHYMDCPIPEVKNIGWLDKEHYFNRGEVSTEFLDKLEFLIFISRKNINILANKLRGSYDCPICGKRKEKIVNGDKTFTLGSAEIWIPDYRKEGNYFATFGLIIHYIKEHGYKPPEEFTDSVVVLNVMTEFNVQEIREYFSEKSYLENQKN
jgi:hypothetical protein